MKPGPATMTCPGREPLPDEVEDAFVDRLESCPLCFQSFAERLVNQPDARMILLMTQASPN